MTPAVRVSVTATEVIASRIRMTTTRGIVQSADAKKPPTNTGVAIDSVKNAPRKKPQKNVPRRDARNSAAKKPRWKNGGCMSSRNKLSDGAVAREGVAMAACELCWAIYQERQLHGWRYTYGDVLAEFDGKHTPEEQCGDMHTLIEVNGVKRCRCGKRVGPSEASAGGGRTRTRGER